jgi:hypothetical protein
VDDKKDKSEKGENQRKINNTEENKDIPDSRVGKILIKNRDTSYSSRQDLIPRRTK